MGRQRLKPLVLRRWLRSVALLAAALLLSACRDSPPAGGPLVNLILINIDTLRADHLGAYGYSRPTSPVLDRLAAEGVVFTDSVASSSFTRESVSALFTGVLPSRGGATGWDAHPGETFPTLAEVLRRAGYQTALLDLTPMLMHADFGRGFDHVEHLTKRGRVSRLGPQLSQRALDVIAGFDAQRPFFVYLHYLDPHGPYDPPPDALERFGGDPLAMPLDLYQDLRPRLAEMREDGFNPGSEDFADVVRLYDAEIFDTDRAVGRLLDGLRQRGGDTLARTLIVVTADHGEEFLEHDFVEHSWTLYEESIRVPLIFWGPSQLAPSKVAARVSTVDVYPTVLALLGVTPPDAALDGQALFIGGAGARQPATSADRPQISELLLSERNVMRSVRAGNWKYVASQRWLDPDERSALSTTAADGTASAGPAIDLWAVPVREELYDLASDPHEKNNRLASEPAVARRLAEVLADYRRRCAAPPPARTLTAEDEERLRALGYLPDRSPKTQ